MDEELRKIRNNGCNCNSRTPAGGEFAGDDNGEICGCNHMMKEILRDKCGCSPEKTDEDVMTRILERDCGCKAEYASDFNADEYVADDVELAADEAFDNGEILYRNTGNYHMVTAENHCTEDDDIFDYQGS